MAFLKLCNNTYNCVIFYNRTFKSISSKFKSISVSYGVRRFCLEHNMKVLNVAEKHDAAKNIAGYLSRGASRKVNSYIAVNNLLYFFKYNMIITFHSFI